MTDARAPLQPIDAALAELYFGVFTSPNGQKVLADLRIQHYDRSSSIGEGGLFYPTHAVQELEGERSVILRILELMAVGSNASKPKTAKTWGTPVEPEPFDEGVPDPDEYESLR